MGSARNNILAKLKAAQETRGEIGETIPDFTSSVYLPLNPTLSEEFKTNLELIGGQVIFCNTRAEVASQVQLICEEKEQDEIFCTDPILQNMVKGAVKIDEEENDFLRLTIGITGCEFLVAHLGSILISSAQISGRRLNVFPESHIIIAHEAQIVDYLDNALEKIQEKYKNKLPSLISNITGPSRTADIEKTLVMGMHGPKSLIVIIVTETF